METEHWSYCLSGITLPPSPSNINWLRKFKEKNAQIRTYKSTQHVGPELPPEQEENHNRLRQCKEKKDQVLFLYLSKLCFVMFPCLASLPFLFLLSLKKYY